MPYMVQCPSIGWNLKLVSRNSFSCKVLVRRVLVNRNIWWLANTWNKVLDQFGVVPDVVLCTGDQTHTP